MFQCQECNRQFKSRLGLASHVGHAHAKRNPESATKSEASPPGNSSTAITKASQDVEPTSPKVSGDNASAQAQPLPDAVENPSNAEQIRQYIKQGFSFRQLRDIFHFNESTVRQELAKYVPPDDPVKEETSTATEKKAPTDATTKKEATPGATTPEAAAADSQAEEKGDGLDIPVMPIILKAGQGQEVISPEGILRSCLLSDGDPGRWMFRGMMLLRAAQLMNLTDVEIMKGQADAQARAVKPIFDMMEQARREMDDAAARAKESTIEVAEAAAAGAAARATMRIDERFDELMESRKEKVDIATVPDPMKGLMARTMEMMMNQLTGMLLGNQAGHSNPGLIDKRIQEGK